MMQSSIIRHDQANTVMAVSQLFHWMCKKNFAGCLRKNRKYLLKTFQHTRLLLIWLLSCSLGYVVLFRLSLTPVYPYPLLFIDRTGYEYGVYNTVIVGVTRLQLDTRLILETMLLLKGLRWPTAWTAVAGSSAPLPSWFTWRSLCQTLFQREIYDDCMGLLNNQHFVSGMIDVSDDCDEFNDILMMSVVLMLLGLLATSADRHLTTSTSRLTHPQTLQLLGIGIPSLSYFFQKLKEQWGGSANQSYLVISKLRSFKCIIYRWTETNLKTTCPRALYSKTIAGFRLISYFTNWPCVLQPCWVAARSQIVSSDFSV